MIDEADTYLRGNTAMRGILNAGNARETAFVLRLGKRLETVQADAAKPGPGGQGVVRYNCWCPKAIALIGSVPETIADRAIVVRLSRKLTTEPSASMKEFPAGAAAAPVPAICPRPGLQDWPDPTA